MQGTYSILSVASQVGSAANMIKNMGLGLRIWLVICICLKIEVPF